MKWLLIDGHGHVSSVTSSRDWEDLVKNSGVTLVGFSDKFCQIYIRPSLIAFRGFAVLSQLLRKANPERSIISWYGVDWRNEIVRNQHTTVERLIELMLEPQPVNRFYRKPLPLDSLDASHQLSPLIDLWRANGDIDLRQDSDAIAAHTSGKYLVSSQDADSHQIKFIEFGKTKWAVYDSHRWTMRCIGQPVQNQPDYEYGRWTADGYRDAMRIRVPTLSDMDVIVIDTATNVARRLLYKRLTLPVRSSYNRMVLLSTSCHDLSVSLRSPID